MNRLNSKNRRKNTRERCQFSDKDFFPRLIRFSICVSLEEITKCHTLHIFVCVMNKLFIELFTIFARTLSLIEDQTELLPHDSSVANQIF